MTASFALPLLAKGIGGSAIPQLGLLSIPSLKRIRIERAGARNSTAKQSVPRFQLSTLQSLRRSSHISSRMRVSSHSALCMLPVLASNSCTATISFLAKCVVPSGHLCLTLQLTGTSLTAPRAQSECTLSYTSKISFVPSQECHSQKGAILLFRKA